MDDEPYDALVIGGGPAGLSAAIYLARFHLRTLVVDRGGGRARSIPRTRNHAGYPEGVAGVELVQRMGAQAAMHGARIVAAEATGLRREGGLFHAETTAGPFAARAALLATGGRDVPPPMGPAEHDRALNQGLLRYCPICDGYEASDQDIGVLSDGEHGVREAEFLRGFSARVTLVGSAGPLALTHAQRERVEAAGVRLLDGPCAGLRIDGDRIAAALPGGEAAFDTMYAALGATYNSALAQAVGAHVSPGGCVTVDRRQRTSVPGLYAAGDVVLGLDQISHAMGEAGVAATALRNDLAAVMPLRRAAARPADGAAGVCMKGKNPIDSCVENVNNVHVGGQQQGR